MLRRMTRFVALPMQQTETYSPLYFLAALGNGGVAIACIIYLNFLVPHPQTPILTFEALAQFITSASLVVHLLLLVLLSGVVLFTLRHLWLLAENVREYMRHRSAAAAADLRPGNNELLLTLAMTATLSSASSAMLIPGLWAFVEYLFPVVLLVFMAIGIAALYSGEHSSSQSQTTPTLTFALVGVGVAVPAAMSQQPITVQISVISALFFASVTLLVGLHHLMLTMHRPRSSDQQPENSIALWSLLPLLGLLGIAGIFVARGLVLLFAIPTDAASLLAVQNQANPTMMLALTTVVLALQTLLGAWGYVSMRRVGYFQTFVAGSEHSSGSYALVWTATTFSIFGMFFIHMGLLHTGQVPMFSLSYYLLLAPFVAAQVYALVTLVQFDRKLLVPAPTATAQPARPAPRRKGANLMSPTRRRTAAIIWWFLPIVAIAGWFLPYLGYLMLICMLAPVVIGAFRGRLWCGWVCPRGSFFDYIMARFSRNKPAPAWLRSKAFRNGMIAFLMTVMGVQLTLAWPDPAAIGRVFIMLLTVTTIVGMGLAVAYRPRTWCSFCPMGTMTSWFSHGKRPLNVTSACKDCSACGKVCPMYLTPQHPDSSHASCIKCERCVMVCPRNAISFEQPQDAA